MKKLKLILMSCAIGAGLTTGALAENFRSSTWLPDSETTTVTLKWFFDELSKQTDGAVNFEMFVGGALMPAKAHLGGIGDGVAQEGFHTSGYTPSELPIANALAGFGFIEPDPVTIGLAWADFAMNDEEQNREFLNNGVVPVAAFSTLTYPIICNTSEPITELAQLKGLKVRSINLIGKLVQDLGGTPVNIPAPEIYQALQNGQIDCAGISPTYLNIDNSLDEVSKSVTMMEWTGSYNSPWQIYNADFWKGLTPDQRSKIFELAARGQAKIQIQYENLKQKALNDAMAKGLKVVQPAESITKAVDAWVAAGVGDMAGVAKETYGIADPAALFDRFDTYVKKWQGLVGGMKNKFDEDELTQLMLDNLYNTVDPATYGTK